MEINNPETKNSFHKFEDRIDFNFGRLFFGLLLFFGGVVLLARSFGLINFTIHFGWAQIWPFLIIIGGLSLIKFRGILGSVIGIILAFILVAIILLMLILPNGQLNGSCPYCDQSSSSFVY